jgi:hypothetical protein
MDPVTSARRGMVMASKAQQRQRPTSAGEEGTKDNFFSSRGNCMSNLAKSQESGAGRRAFAGADYFVKFHKDVGRSSVMQLLFCRLFKIAISEATGELMGPSAGSDC